MVSTPGTGVGPLVGCGVAAEGTGAGDGTAVSTNRVGGKVGLPALPVGNAVGGLVLDDGTGVPVPVDGGPDSRDGCAEGREDGATEGTNEGWSVVGEGVAEVGVGGAVSAARVGGNVPLTAAEGGGVSALIGISVGNIVGCRVGSAVGGPGKQTSQNGPGGFAFKSGSLCSGHAVPVNMAATVVPGWKILPQEQRLME